MRVKMLNIYCYNICYLFQIYKKIDIIWIVGDIVQVVNRGSTDTTPLYESTSTYYNGFTGFRIWIALSYRLVPQAFILE